jgi:hypothetical protein
MATFKTKQFTVKSSDGMDAKDDVLSTKINDFCDDNAIDDSDVVDVKFAMVIDEGYVVTSALLMYKEPASGTP